MHDHVTLFDRAFATTIAFALPGLAVLVGASTVTPVIAGWFGAAATGTTIVGFLFVVFAAIAVGMVVTALRWWIFERFHVGPYRLVPVTDVAVNEQQRTPAYEDLRFSHYYHYLASANMAIAIPLAVLIWIIGAHPAWQDAVVVGSIAAPVVAVLGAAGRDALARYRVKRLRLTGVLREA